MKLSNNFRYEEFFVSDSFPEYAELLKEKHLDDEEMQTSFTEIALLLLQPIRDVVNTQVNILSGYRDEWLNTKVGGVASSDHLLSMACDFTFNGDLEKLFDWAVTSLPYRQIIYYPNNNFIHISVNDISQKEMKHEALVKLEGGYVSYDKYKQGA